MLSMINLVMWTVIGVLGGCSFYLAKNMAKEHDRVKEKLDETIRREF